MQLKFESTKFRNLFILNNINFGLNLKIDNVVQQKKFKEEINV